MWLMLFYREPAQLHLRANGHDATPRRLTCVRKPDKTRNLSQQSIMQSDKLSSPRFVVRRSSIHGRGVFANQDIGPAELVSEYKGARLRWQDVVEHASQYGMTPGHTFLFDTGDGTVIDGASGGNSMRWMNHACEPNCKAYVSDARVFIYVLRHVNCGEELTIDYALVVDGTQTPEIRELYRCNCGSPHCRGTMLGKSSPPEEVRSHTSMRLAAAADFEPPEVHVLERCSATTIIVAWHEAARCHYAEQLWIRKKAARDGYCALSKVRVRAGDLVFVPKGNPAPLNHTACIAEKAVSALPLEEEV